MKCTLILVTSVNGKLTRGASSNIYRWTSKEDSTLFFSLIAKHQLIIMGRKTYEASRRVMTLVPEKVRIVLTRFPQRYTRESVPHQLEFTSESPGVLVARVEQAGYTEALIVGGSAVAASFLRANLIDTLHVTVEPYLFGKGTPFLQEADLDIRLRLVSLKKLNTRGTIHLVYTVH